MSNLIEFLQRLGQDSRLSHATAAELHSAMTQAGLDPAASTALAALNRSDLQQHVGATPNVCCLIYHAEESDEGEAEPATQVRNAA